jgi:hypothetical protein
MRAFAVLLLVLTVATHAADTAYAALRALGAQRGEDSLHRVIELRSSRDTWKILVADSRARTGLREIQVRNGRIIRDAAVTKAHDSTTPLNLSALNLDSDGALMIVNQQQQSPHELTAERVDYTLTNGSTRNAPVWILKVRERRDASVTSVQIAADTGEVITQLEIADDAPYAEGIDASENRDPPIANESPRKERTSQPSGPRVPDVPEAVERAVDHVERGARRLKRFLPF